MVITIAGGGSTFTAGIVKSIALRREELEVDEIRLFDINKERQDKVAVVVDWVLHKELNTDIKLVVTTNVQQAYTDASFVFAQMRVGGYAMREQDEKIPLRHGCVGQETCGCGGMAYGMRTIFPMIKLIDDVEKYAKKDYWILNYSNPAAIVSEACRKLRPKARIINICDMPIAIIDVVAAAMGIQNKKEIVYDYFGLNHFGWFTKVRLNGEDVTEKLKSYVAEHGYMPQNAKSDVLHSDPSWLHTYANAKNICSAFHDYLPNTYMQYYLLGDEVVKSSDPNHTRANEVMEGREKRIFDAVADYRAGKDVDLTKFFGGVHGEFIVDVAMSLAFDLRKRYLVMVENNGAVENLPSDAMVEIPAYITDRGPEPVRVGEIPTFYKGLIEQQEAVEKLIVDAAVEHSYEKALMAFTLSKTVPSLLVAKKILDDMIVANKAYWPELH